MNHQGVDATGRLALWHTLERFEVDDDPACALPFVARLARENGWPREHAARVFDEYRKFLYLAVVAGHPVTPSDDVDQAWHLHLAYTRSYWDDLCGRVLGRPLHHGPTQGGSAEDRKYESWYQATLESYWRVFGMAPDSRIWPRPSERFSAANRFVRVNRRLYHITLKQRPNRVRWPHAAGLAACLATAVSCTVADTGAGAILGLVAAGVIVALVAQARRQPRRRDDSGGDSGYIGGHAGDSSSSDCDPGNSNCDPGAGGDGGASGCGSSGCGGGGCGGGD
jgi:hypothetical protein